TPLTVEATYEGSPSFSPDGETIAYTSNRSGNFEIYLKQVSGGPDIDISNNPADDIDPAYSPDGKQIAFVSTRASPIDLHYPGPDSPLTGGDLWLMPALGGSAKRIAQAGNFPSWSPDGSMILFVAGPWFHQKHYKIPYNGGAAEEIPIHSLSNPAARLYYPNYSPDGRWILFDAGTYIYLLDAKGGEPRQILNGSCAKWADSGTILYT